MLQSCLIQRLFVIITPNVGPRILPCKQGEKSMTEDASTGASRKPTVFGPGKPIQQLPVLPQKQNADGEWKRFGSLAPYHMSYVTFDMNQSTNLRNFSRCFVEIPYSNMNMT